MLPTNLGKRQSNWEENDPKRLKSDKNETSSSSSAVPSPKEQVLSGNILSTILSFSDFTYTELFSLSRVSKIFYQTCCIPGNSEIPFALKLQLNRIRSLSTIQLRHFVRFINGFSNKNEKEILELIISKLTQLHEFRIENRSLSKNLKYLDFFNKIITSINLGVSPYRPENFENCRSSISGAALPVLTKYPLLGSISSLNLSNTGDACTIFEGLHTFVQNVSSINLSRRYHEGVYFNFECLFPKNSPRKTPFTSFEMQYSDFEDNYDGIKNTLVLDSCAFKDMTRLCLSHSNAVDVKSFHALIDQSHTTLETLKAKNLNHEACNLPFETSAYNYVATEIRKKIKLATSNALSTLPHHEYPKLKNCEGDLIPNSKGFTQLEHYSPQTVGDYLLEILSKIRNLTSLDLRFCKYTRPLTQTDANNIELYKQNNLLKLDLSCNILDVNWLSFFIMISPNVQDLMLFSDQYFIDDDNIKLLSNLFYENLVPLLSNCKKLKKICLAHLETTSKRATQTYDFQNLESLNLRCSGINDSWFNALIKNAKSLRQINLDNTGLESVTLLAFFQQIPNAQSLILSNIESMDDAALTVISTHCPHLQHLDISHCKNITKQGIEDFLKNSREIRTLIYNNETPADNSLLKTLINHPSLDYFMHQTIQRPIPEKEVMDSFVCINDFYAHPLEHAFNKEKYAQIEAIQKAHEKLATSKKISIL